MTQPATDLRSEVLERYGALEDGPGRDLERLVELTAQVCGVPTAAVNLLTTTEQHMVATTGIDRSVCAREDSMCAVVAEEPDPVFVPDASRDPRFAHNPFVTGRLGEVRLYASAPLVSSDGLAIGRLCVFDDRPGQLDDSQLRALATLATSVVDVLDLRLRSRQLEQSLSQLTATRDELRRSNEDLARFAHQVSHDLRTPLTAILASAEMLAEEPPVREDEFLGALVEAVTTSGRRMDDLIGRVLEHAVEGGSLNLQPVAVTTAFERARADLRPALEAAGGEVRLHDLPVVDADPDLVYVVALNLLTNAVKFARPGVPPCVEVAAHPVTAGWRVTVSDNGTGIAPERAEEVFGLFTRDDDVADGHGIGLATVRRVLEAHGGSVGVAPHEGPGTTVWFELPR